MRTYRPSVDLVITAVIVLAIIARAAVPTLPPAVIVVGLMIAATAVARRTRG